MNNSGEISEWDKFAEKYEDFSDRLEQNGMDPSELGELIDLYEKSRKCIRH